MQTNSAEYYRLFLDCDYLVQDTLVVATSKKAYKQDIEHEHEARLKLGYSSDLFDKTTLAGIIGSRSYYGGVAYPGSFGINSYLYCQGMMRVLADSGVKIFEESPVLSIDGHRVITPYGEVEAGHIVLCTDRFTPDLGVLSYEIYHAQTFLMMSAPLTDDDISRIFPQRSFMVWDTDLIYNYFRLGKQNRLLLGGLVSCRPICKNRNIIIIECIAS